MPPLCVEIATSDEVGSTDMEAIMRRCESKFDERKYGKEMPGAVQAAFAWDRKSCRIELRRFGEKDWSGRSA